jgi:hypothetical protein
MRFSLLCVIAILGIISFTPVAFCNSTANGLQIEIGDQKLKSKYFLLDLGYQPENRPITIRVGVRNTRSSSLQLDAFKYSENLDVRWTLTNDPHKLETRSTLTPGELRELEVRIMPSRVGEFPYFVFSSGGKPVSIFGFGYTLAPTSIVVETGGAYWSGYADAYSNYKLCAGPAPPRYHIDSKATGVSAHTVEGQHGRNCNAYMHCKPQGIDDSDACYAIEIQGHLKWASFFGGWDDQKEFVKVDVRLRAKYDLTPSDPTLSAIKPKIPQQ